MDSDFSPAVGETYRRARRNLFQPFKNCVIFPSWILGLPVHPFPNLFFLELLRFVSLMIACFFILLNSGILITILASSLSVYQKQQQLLSNIPRITKPSVISLNMFYFPRYKVLKDKFLRKAHLLGISPFVDLLIHW